MGYERYPRSANSERDQYGRQESQDYRRDHGSGREYGYSGARNRDDSDRGRYGQQSYGAGGYGRGQQQGDQARYAQGDEYHGSYASDGRRFEDVGPRRDWDDDDRGDQGRPQARQRGGRQPYGRQPQGYDYDDRGFFARAGDEVRSWFGDEDAERRREADTRYEERSGGRNYGDRDHDYHSWRTQQMSQLDRDYDEYRRENRTKFENEFATWRTSRQGQRDLLGKVEEHMEVEGSDGQHVGTVDKVRGDRIILTKNDADAGGRHHSIPSRWLKSVDAKVTLEKTADEAKRHWRDEERQAMFGDDDRNNDDGRGDDRGRMLNRSFSGTY